MSTDSCQFTTSVIFNDFHQDLIHHVEFDYYGRRIATSSSDMTVCVWDLSSNGTWIKSDSWKSHGGPVWKVIWAHPEFGQILATCSFDRSVVIWEETAKLAELHPNRSYVSPDHKRPVKFWKRCCQLVDSRHNVTDIKFAPRHLGLMIGTVSSQGILRLYEAADIMNLSMWSLNHDIAAFKHRCSALTWSGSRLARPLIAVGSDDTHCKGTKVVIYEYQDNLRKWQILPVSIDITEPVTDISFAPSAGRSFHILAVASKDIQIFKLNEYNKKKLLNEEDFDVEEPTNYELSLIGSLESTNEDEMSSNIDNAQSGGCTRPSEYNISLMGELQNVFNPTIQVWRISWNITGTVLVAGSSDGVIRVWKAAFLNRWNLVATIKLDEDNKKIEDIEGNTTSTFNIISNDNHVYY